MLVLLLVLVWHHGLCSIQSDTFLEHLLSGQQVAKVNVCDAALEMEERILMFIQTQGLFDQLLSLLILLLAQHLLNTGLKASDIG